MKRINNYDFYELGAVIRPLTELAWNTSQNGAVMPIFRAKNKLQSFLDGKTVSLSVSIPAAKKLLDAVERIVPNDGNWPEETEKELAFHGLWISGAAKEFEYVLAAELEGLDTYFVSQTGIFSTAQLIESAENALPLTIRSELSEQARSDFCQAGKSLAFGLPTACGFHLLRAVESVLTHYLSCLQGDNLELKSSERNWGKYIEKLKATGKADEKVISVLDHLRSLHRNPLMHPEDVLTNDEALTLFGIVQSAIVAIVLHLISMKSGTQNCGSSPKPQANLLMSSDSN